MNNSGRSKSADLHMRALASCIAACWPLLASTALASTHQVTNCSDSDPGSLRAVIGDASTNSDDIIDMTGLMCSPITLDTGITISQKNLTINGPGQDALSIVRNGGVKHRIFRHTGAYGMLSLTEMTLASGNIDDSNTPPAMGGCIYSAGSLELDHVTVRDCTVTSATQAIGGGIFAQYNLTLRHSTVSGNSVSVNAGASGTATGGGAGVIVGRTFTASDSTIRNNSAYGGGMMRGGGVLAATLAITASTISGNHADGSGGGIYLPSAPPLIRLDTATITNSTISGNDAALFAGGIYSNASLTLQNSTIVSNTAGVGVISLGGNTTYMAAGLAMTSGKLSVILQMESSLLANNTWGSNDYDLDFSTTDVAPNTVFVGGSDNLIRALHGSAPNAITGACPLLGPLRDNGGETRTRALLSTSPGINAGNNLANLDYDQRRSPFVRSRQTTDIGAYEIQADIIFNSSFDGCAVIGP